jgi:hypothetical protein
MFVPPWLDEIERALDDLQAGWPSEMHLRSRLYSHFCGTAVRFAPAFARVRDEDVKALTVYCHLFVAAVLAQDTLLDRSCPAEEAGQAAMRVMALESEGYALLYRLFPSGSRFWQRHRACLQDHARAFVEEEAFRRGQRPLHDYTEPVALRAAAHKIGLVRIVIAALAEFEGDERSYSPICASLSRVGEAMGMYDDLFDWKDDLRKGQPSLLLSRVLRELPGPMSDEAFRALTREVGRAIHYGGHSRYVLELGLASLDEADGLEASLPGLPWYEHTHTLRAQMTTALREIETMVRAGVEKALRAPSGPPRSPVSSSVLRPWTVVA